VRRDVDPIVLRSAYARTRPGQVSRSAVTVHHDSGC